MLSAAPWFISHDNPIVIARFDNATITVGSPRRSASIPALALMGRAILPNLRRALRCKRLAGLPRRRGHSRQPLDKGIVGNQVTTNPLSEVEMARVGVEAQAGVEKARGGEGAMHASRPSPVVSPTVVDDMAFPQLAVARPRAGDVDLYVLDVVRAVVARVWERQGGSAALQEWLKAYEVDVDALMKGAEAQ